MGTVSMPDETVRLGRYASPGVGSVNSWWLETADAVLIVDAQRQLSQAAEVARLVDAIGKSVAAIVLTHPHPDHVGGLPALHAAFPAADIIAAGRTAEVMRTDEGGLFALTRSFLGEDFAAALPVVTTLLPDAGEITLSRQRIVHTELGVGETAAACLYHLPDAGLAIIGDVAANAMTPWLVEGHTAAWLSQIEHAAALLPSGTRALPGHGADASADLLLAGQRDYLLLVRRLTLAAAVGGTLTAAQRRSVLAEIERRHPGWAPVAGVPDLPAKNIDAVAREFGLEVQA